MRYFLLLILFFFTVTSGVGNAFMLVGSRPPAAAGGGCSISEQQTTDTDYWPANTTDYLAQGILDQGTQTLCAVTVKLDILNGETVHAELWTTADRTGSQIGGDSDGFTTSANTTYSITWTTWPSVTGAYFLHLVADDGSPNFDWRSNTDDTLYGTGVLADNISRAGGTDLNADAVFSISY